jgi:hypothetical protein
MACQCGDHRQFRIGQRMKTVEPNRRDAIQAFCLNPR